MRRKEKNSNKPKPETQEAKAEAEVEELLKAVEEEMLLNLSLNSHTSRVAPDYLRSDLDRRFRALKTTPQPPSSSSSSSAPAPSPSPSPIPKNPRPSSAADPELDAVLGGDLAARFTALRASLPAPAPESAGVWDGLEEEDDEDEDEQVERLIRWAKDAARLDPSPPSDDEFDEDEDEDDEPRSVK